MEIPALPRPGFSDDPRNVADPAFSLRATAGRALTRTRVRPVLFH
jgi:hypothetical protein